MSHNRLNDDILAFRLAKLLAPDKPVPTEEELALRLKSLEGFASEESSKSPQAAAVSSDVDSDLQSKTKTKPSAKSIDEDVESLLARIGEEVRLEGTTNRRQPCDDDGDDELETDESDDEALGLSDDDISDDRESDALVLEIINQAKDEAALGREYGA